MARRPYDAGPLLPRNARFAASAVLIDGGRRALAPSAPLGELRAVWLRDGLGRRSAAQVERQALALGVALLRLEEAPVQGAGLPLASRDPFAGSPSFTVEYALTPDPAPAWPVLRTSFVGMPDGAAGLATLGIEMSLHTGGGARLRCGALPAALQVIGVP